MLYTRRIIIASIFAICLSLISNVYVNAEDDTTMVYSYPEYVVTWYGDSLTQGYTFCEIVNNNFDFVGHNSGVIGTTIANTSNSSMCMTIRMQYDKEEDIRKDSDMIVVMGGVNDWILDVEPGDVDTAYEEAKQGIYNDKTFAGGCNAMFANLRELFPKAHIVVLGTTYANGVVYNVMDNNSYERNKWGLTSLEYGDMLCQIAHQWDIDYIHLGRALSWDSSNILEYCADGIHFGPDLASKEVAEIVIEYMKTLPNIRWWYRL